MKTRMKIFSAILAVCMASVSLCGCGNAEAETAKTADGGKNTVSETAPQKKDKQRPDPFEMTTAEVVKDMGLGINLGNTFECSGLVTSTVQGYETAWGSPVITKEMIQGYKNCGFDSIRIPVAWSNMMDKKTFAINPEYIGRVKEVVGWALDSDLYVVMNIHWDGGWFERFGQEKNREWAFNKYETIWKQLSEEFKDYDGYLIFESLNEELGWDELWNRYSNQGDKELSFGIGNDINQRFVDIVRASGGNNAKRHLLIAGYGTDIELTCDPLYKMPDDPEKRCAVSVHYYTPSVFAILEEDASWGKCRDTWGTDADMAELAKYMDMMKTNYVDKGIPVIIGEYGCPIKNKEEESKRKFISSVCKEAYDRGMCPMLWDITQTHYDREKQDFRDPELLKGIMAAKNK